MASLTASGLVSGLDVNTLVSNLMTVEQQPLVALNTKEASYQAKISALGSVKSALAALQTAAEGLIPPAGNTAAEKYTTTTATASDTTLFSAAANNSVAAGSYTLSEITLAHAQQVRKSGFTIPAGAGTLDIKVGTGTAVAVAIDANATLSTIRDAINASSAGVTASIVNDGTNDNLILTAKNSGAANTISVTGSAGFESFNYSSGTTNSWVNQQPANDATFKLNGITITSATNSITTAISGLTINLLKDNAGSATLTVAKSNNSVTTSLNGFIKAYNDAMGVMKNLTAYNANTKVAATLNGSSTVRSAQSQLRSMLFTASGGSNADLQRLSDIGVSLQLDGTLKLDSTKLNNAISSDFNSVANLVSDVGTRFKTTISAMVGSDGLVAGSIDGLNATIKDIGKRRDAINLHLQKVEANYRKQFTALDVQLTNMKQTSASLAQQLASLPSAR
ncbi:MAG: flagellar filament capping protein FliD [Betaproteobacteria bacterium]